MKKFRNIFVLMLLAVLMSLGVASGSALAANSGETGLVTEDGVKHYYENGKLVKNKIGVEINSKYYSIDSKGVVTKISDKALGMASVQLTELGITPNKAAKESSLKKAFKWVYTNVNYDGKLTNKKRKTESYYARYGFKNKIGNCEVQASCFYYMALALGYKANYVYGFIPKTTGGYQTHAWVTIKMSGKLYVFDPNFAWVYHNPNGGGYGTKKVHSGYKLTYTKTGTKLQYTYYYQNKKGKYKQYK